MSATIGAARIELSINSARFEAQMKRAEAAVGKFKSSLNSTQRRFRSTGRKMQSIGSSLQRNVSLPLLAIGGASLKAASDFESAFTGVRKTVDATQAQYAQLRGEILQMSKQIPATAAEIAGVTEVAGQLGVRGVKNLMKFTRTAIDMGNSTNVAAEDAATAMARIDKITGGTQTTFDRLGSSVVEVGNNFATTEDRIFDAAQRLAGVGATAGLTQAQIVGIAGAITSTSDRVESGSTAISKAISTITSAVSTGGSKLANIASIAGMTAGEFQRAFKEDAAAALTSFVEGLAHVQQSGQDVYSVLNSLGLSGERVSQNILALAGANTTLRDAINASTKAWNENNALTTEAEKRYKDFNQRLQVNINKLNAVGIAIGRKLMPYFSHLVTLIVDMAQAFAHLNPAIQDFVLVIGGLGIAIPGVLTALGVLANTVIPALITGFGVLASATGPIIGAVAVLGTLLGLVGGFTSRAHKATAAQNSFINAVKKGNKTLAQASNAISNLSTQEEFYASRSLLRQKQQEFERIKKLYENLDDLTSDTLIKEGGRSNIRQRYQALKKEIAALGERKEKLRALNDAENKLHEAQKIYADWSDANKQRQIAPYQQRVDALRKELGMLGSVQKAAKKASDAVTKAQERAGRSMNFMASVGFNHSMDPVGRLSVPTNISGLEKLKAQAQDARSSLQIALEGVSSDTRSFLENFRSNFKKVGSDFKTFMTGQIANAFTNFSASVGKSIFGVGDQFKSSFDKVISIVADFAVQLGQILIAIGTAMTFTGILSGPGGAYLAAGAALVAVGSGVQALMSARANERSANDVTVPAAANGGVFRGPSLAMVGDNPDAKVNPEVVSSVGELEGLINSGGGQMNESVIEKAMTRALSRAQLKASGDDLVLVINSASKTNR